MTLSRIAWIVVDTLLVLSCLCMIGWLLMFRMPGEPYRGELPPQTEAREALEERLREHVELLAGEYPNRHLEAPEPYAEVRDVLYTKLEKMGYEPRRETYEVRDLTAGNIVAERPGSSESDEVVIVGAHYDAVPTSPGADDNASGVAGLLELARQFADVRPETTLRFVLFSNEEAPYFRTDAMGSLRHARQARDAGEEVVAMLSLEMLGYYTNEPGTQQYPPLLSWLYPDRGNFIGFVGNFTSRAAVKKSIGAFRRHAEFPAYGFAGPGFMPGVGLSDHSAFWKAGYPALMVTDTAFYRNPHYHRPSDTPETLDYDRFARVVEGLEAVVEAWVGGGE